MSLNEVLTCVREDLPTIAIVFNNGQWGAEKKNQVRSEIAFSIPKKNQVTLNKYKLVLILPCFSCP